MKLIQESGHFVAKMILLIFVLILSWPVIAHSEDPLACPPGVPEVCECGFLPAEPEPQQILTCIPSNFNGILVLYAHGYVNPQEPLALPLEELENFFPLIGGLQDLGFGFATTSYSKNGYAIEQAGENLNALVGYFKTLVPTSSVRKVLITGASEGGIIATMLIEKFDEIYDGGLALCGPVGGMPTQIRYLGDFRVVFDYFFPDVIPLDGIYDRTPVDLDDWEVIKDAIKKAIAKDPVRAMQLFKVTRVAADPGDLAESAIDVLKFSVLGTNDMVTTSDGFPYGNRFRWYHGSENDFALNFGVERVDSDFIGRRYVRRFYNTTGKLTRPLVTLHTTGDDVVPFKHELIYCLKVALQGRSDNLISIPIIRDGHCEFEIGEILSALLLLIFMTS